MSRSLMAVIAGKATSLAALATAVLVGGVVGGALSISNAGAQSGSPAAKVQSSHQAKPHASHSTDPHGVHGKCVSKVARDNDAVGGPHHNHGGAVSAAAHSCPRK